MEAKERGQTLLTISMFADFNRGDTIYISGSSCKCHRMYKKQQIPGTLLQVLVADFILEAG